MPENSSKITLAWLQAVFYRQQFESNRRNRNCALEKHKVGNTDEITSIVNVVSIVVR